MYNMTRLTCVTLHIQPIFRIIIIYFHVVWPYVYKLYMPSKRQLCHNDKKWMENKINKTKSFNINVTARIVNQLSIMRSEYYSVSNESKIMLRYILRKRKLIILFFTFIVNVSSFERF